MKRAYAAVVLGLVFAALSLCAAEHHHHEHKPPHGGTLVVLGEGVAHLELVLDARGGTLTVYVLDGEADKAMRVKQKEIEVRVSLAEKTGDPAAVALKAVPNILTGETEGDTSQFEGHADLLKGATRFSGVVTAFTVRGVELKGVSFKFPEGNEEPEK